MLLDRTELSVGTWYISVVNAEEATEPLKFRLEADLLNVVECPSNTPEGGAACSGHGACDATLGRCDCDGGYTLDDCSAHARRLTNCRTCDN